MWAGCMPAAAAAAAAAAAICAAWMCCMEGCGEGAWRPDVHGMPGCMPGCGMLGAGMPGGGMCMPACSSTSQQVLDLKTSSQHAVVAVCGTAQKNTTKAGRCRHREHMHTHRQSGPQNKTIEMQAAPGIMAGGIIMLLCCIMRLCWYKACPLSRSNCATRSSRNLLSCFSWWFSTRICVTYLMASARIVGLSVLGSLPGSIRAASSANLQAASSRETWLLLVKKGRYQHGHSKCWRLGKDVCSMQHELNLQGSRYPDVSEHQMLMS